MARLSLPLVDKPQNCDYRIRNTWGHDTGRLAEYSRPFEIPPLDFVCCEGAHLVSEGLIGLEASGHLISETTPFVNAVSAEHQAEFVRLAGLAPTVTFDSAICPLIDFRGWHNQYFHWFLDFLPRVLAVERFFAATRESCKLIIPSRPSEWQIHSLQRLGWTEESLITNPATDQNAHIRVRMLIASSSHRCPMAPSVPYDAMSPAIVRELKCRLTKTTDGELGYYPERILISRRNAASRRMLNETEIRNLLEPLGFECVEPDRLSLADQIRLFSRASHIVAVHGAGLTNLLYAENASVLEIFSSDHGIRPEYFQLSGINRLRYFFAVADSVNDQCDVVVDQSIVAEFVELTS